MREENFVTRTNQETRSFRWDQHKGAEISQNMTSLTLLQRLKTLERSQNMTSLLVATETQDIREELANGFRCREIKDTKRQ